MAVVLVVELKDHPAAPPTVWLWYPVVAVETAVTKRAKTASCAAISGAIDGIEWRLVSEEVFCDY